MTCSSGGSTTEMSATDGPRSVVEHGADVGACGLDHELHRLVGVLEEADAVARRRGDRRGEADLDDLGGEQGAPHGGDLVVVDHLAVVDDDGPLGDVLDVGHVVAREEDRGALLLVEAHEQLAEPLLGHEVEPDGRLVEEQDLRVVEQARGELAAHPLAEREVAHRLVEQVGGAEQLAELGDRAAARRRGRARRSPRASGTTGAAPARATAATAGRTACRSAGRAAAAPPTARCPSTRASPLGGVEDPGEDLDRGRLPGPVRTDVGEPLAGRHVEVERRARPRSARRDRAATGREDLREPPHLDRHATGCRPTRPRFCDQFASSRRGRDVTAAGCRTQRCDVCGRCYERGMRATRRSARQKRGDRAQNADRGGRGGRRWARRARPSPRRRRAWRRSRRRAG